MRQLIFFVLISQICAYPRWFHDYKTKHRKAYTKKEDSRFYHILRQKYNLVKKHSNDGVRL